MPKGLAKKIVEEVNAKYDDYYSAMGSYLERIGEWGDMFRVKPPARGKSDRSYSNPRLTEFFRAGNTLGTMSYRMQTAQDPFFEPVPMSVIEGTDRLLKIQGTLETQLDESQYRRKLLRANMACASFGTVIVEEPRRLIGINPFGRRMALTDFVPRSFLQMAFDRGCMDLDDADWLSTEDLISDAGLMAMGREDEALDTPWNKKVIEDAAKEQLKSADISQILQNKINALGYMGIDGSCQRKSIILYHGKLDCIGDGVEYLVGLISRKHLARFHPHRNQHGKRNFRIARWIEDPLGLDALGLGLGQLVGNLHHSMDANRRRGTDSVIMNSYGMWGRLRTAGIDDTQLKIRPLQIIDMDERDGFMPLPKDLAGADASFRLEELLRAEFRAASGATDTLQGVNDAGGTTASEAALLQNESVRNISVKAELIAQSLVRDHLRVMHSDNVEFIDKPFNINRFYAGTVYPEDLKCDVDFLIKIVTDKDYKPKRLEGLQSLLMTLISTKSEYAERAEINVVPIVQEIARALGVPADKVIRAVPLQPQVPPGAAEPIGEPGAPMPVDISNLGVGEQLPVDNISTPVGDVMGSPQ